MDYGKSGAAKGGRKEPQDKTSKPGKPGAATDKSALLAGMKAAAEAHGSADKSE